MYIMYKSTLRIAWVQGSTNQLQVTKLFSKPSKSSDYNLIHSIFISQVATLPYLIAVTGDTRGQSHNFSSIVTHSTKW